MRLGSLFPLSLIAAALACAAPEQQGAVYGEQITMTDTTLISSILTDPDAYVGERVLVHGTVVEVCEKRGCWLELASDREYETLRVKVEDGVIVFPLSARGRHAVVEGVIERIDLTREQAIEQARHHAEEQGIPFDSTTVTGPTVTYQIRGIGAVIAE
jgi:hypothetical protein